MQPDDRTKTAMQGMGFSSSNNSGDVDDNKLMKLDLKLQAREHLSVRSLVDPACLAR